MLPLWIPACTVITTDDSEDRAFMEKLYRKHRLLMLRTAWRYTNNIEDVKDILSSTCVELTQRIPLLSTLEENALKEYTVKTVRSAAFSYMLLRRQETCVPSEFFESEEAGASADASPPERGMLLREELSRVIAALDRLPPLQRDLIYLRVKEERSYEEIAAAYGITPECARKTVERARKRLKMEVYGREKL